MEHALVGTIFSALPNGWSSSILPYCCVMLCIESHTTGGLSMTLPLCKQSSDTKTNYCFLEGLGTWLTLTLLTWKIRWAPNNASKWQMGFNSAFKGLIVDDQRKCSKCNLELQHRMLHCLNSDLLIHWKIPGVVRIISNPFCNRCSKSWISLTSVA